MTYKVLIIIVFLIVMIGNTSAETVYKDNFDKLDLYKWKPMTSDEWYVKNGVLYVDASWKPGLIYQGFNDTQYISEIDLTADDTQTPNFKQIGFYIYYKDLDNFARVIVENNRGKDKFAIDSKGSMLINQQTYINLSNNPIELNVNNMRCLKLARLNRNIYVYYDGNLALTAQFQDENPSGNVGLHLYSGTDYFDNFSIKSVDIENALEYTDKYSVTFNNPIRFGSYVLYLDNVSGGDAAFRLTKFNKDIGSFSVNEKKRMTLRLEDGREGIIFNIVNISNERVDVEDIVSVDTGYLNLDVNISLLPSYHLKDNMILDFSIKNNGEIRYSGIPLIMIVSGGDTKYLTPILDIGPNESKNFTAQLMVNDIVGMNKLMVSVNIDEYNVIKKFTDYNVTMLNPVLATLSSDFIEDNDISGTVSFETAYPDKFVKWDTNITMEIFRIVQNGRERTYFKNISVTKNKDYNIYIPYSDFYLYDGQYLVSTTLGNMKNERLLQIKGPDGIYNPAERSEIILVSDIINTQLILFLTGMIAAFSIRNYKNHKSNITIDTVIAGCGLVIFIAGIFHSWINVTLYGIFMSGIGLMLNLSRKNDVRVNKLVSLTPTVHDIATLTIIFLSMTYLTLLIPEWNPILTLGTLTVYYIIINI